MRKNTLKQRWVLRGFSLVASIFIWLYVVSSAEIELTKIVKIDLELPENYSIANFPEKEVHFRFKGPGLFVRKFLEKDLKLAVKSASYYRKGKTQFSVRLDKYPLKLPLGVDLLSIEPRTLAIQVERTKIKKVKIKPIFSESILEDFNIKEIQHTPSHIEISGPKSVVNKISEIRTKVISGLEKGSSQKYKSNLVSPDPRIHLGASTVEVSYTLQSKNINFTYNQIPIIFQSTKLVKKADAMRVKVVLHGEEKILKSLPKSGIQVMAYVPEGANKNLDVRLEVELPDGVELKSILPSSVKVELEN